MLLDIREVSMPKQQSSKLVKVYRVEHTKEPTKGKPYLPDHWGDLPTPQNEGLPMWCDLVCGTSSKRMLKKWFRKRDVEFISKNPKYRIVQLLVPKEEVHKGFYQVVFKRNTAKVSKELKYEDLYR